MVKAWRRFGHHDPRTVSAARRVRQPTHSWPLAHRLPVRSAGRLLTIKTQLLIEVRQQLHEVDYAANSRLKIDAKLPVNPVCKFSAKLFRAWLV